ncbi:MAG: spore germination protein [Clostridiaceae bacterium]|nr:spore germination protein [Clostridiaceae bacterium]
MPSIKKLLKDLLIFKEPEKIEKFILKETEAEKRCGNGGGNVGKDNTDGHEKEGTSEKVSCRSGQEGKKQKGSRENKDEDFDNIKKKLSDNIEYLKEIFTIPDNGDVVLREFEIVAKNRVIPACIIYFDGMTNGNIINTNILQPLMLLSNIEIKGNENDVISFVKNHLLTHNQIKLTKKFVDVIDGINFGGCGIFIDGVDVAFSCDVKGWEHRGVERPNTELVLRGPQEGFTELLRVNTALIRKILKDEDLIAESIQIGKKSKTPCSLMFIKDIANDSLVKEVRRRLKGIKIDYIFDTGELEQLLEDDPFMTAPQIVATERPDRVASMLSEGRVAVVMQGSPFVIVMPVTNSDLLHSPEDSYVRFPYANLLRSVRIVAVFMSLLLPGLYIAITNFHHEMIPTDLLLAIEASRERVPFPSVIEILIMEFAFELIREAGIRIPGPIGPTLGIIGALILGQAAVSANIVSPILIIIVAVTGIGSFAIPNFSLGFAFRIHRFAYILLAAMAGFLGITLGLFVQGILLTSAKSFGVPFMAPFGPNTNSGFVDQLLRSPIWKQEKRPDYLNVKEPEKQPKISRQWLDTGKNKK